MRWRTYESRPNGRMLSTGFSAIGPAPPSEPAQTRVSNRAPQAPRVLLSRRARLRSKRRVIQRGLQRALLLGAGELQLVQAGVQAAFSH